jgi:hypothetical protein
MVLEAKDIPETNLLLDYLSKSLISMVTLLRNISGRYFTIQSLVDALGKMSDYEKVTSIFF